MSRCPLCGTEREAHACSNVPPEPFSVRSVIEEIVVDEGGAGKLVAEELRHAGFKVRAKQKLAAQQTCAAPHPREAYGMGKGWWSP